MSDRVEQLAGEVDLLAEQVASLAVAIERLTLEQARGSVLVGGRDPGGP